MIIIGLVLDLLDSSAKKSLQKKCSFTILNQRMSKRERPKFTEILSTSWSFHSGSCAVIGNDYKIHFVGSEKQESENQTISRSQKATAIAWSPLKDILASGWSDGNIGIWENEQFFFTSNEKNEAISLLTWHPTKFIVASLNKKGMISFWERKKSKISLISSKQTELDITQLIFSPEESRNEVYVVTTEGEIYNFIEGIVFSFVYL